MSYSEVYFSFDGRIGRRTFWTGILLILVPSIVIGIIDAMVEAEGTLVTIWQILLIWPSLALSVKRWHDRDKSGWWVLIGFIPIIGAIWSLIETGFLAGTDGPNRFGPETY